MRKRFFLFGIFFQVISGAFAQSDQSVSDAFLITLMVNKFHFQPKAINDSFSGNVFQNILKELDRNKVFFTADDVKALKKFQFEIDDDILKKQSGFLKFLTKLYSERILHADTMITNICKTPFDFQLNEKITAEEYRTYPLNEKASRLKLYKLLKYDVLNEITDGDSADLSAGNIKKYVDSIEPAARMRAAKSYKYPLALMHQAIGGIAAAIGSIYCKAIALAFDPHTEYFTAAEKENFESMLGQHAMVFGFTLKEDDNGSVKIENVQKGSPAFKSGQINKGDFIQTIQWANEKPINVSALNANQLIAVLQMSNSDQATFKITKTDGTERTVTLWKEKSTDDDEDNKVKSFLLKGNKTIGFLSLPDFYEDWEDENGINGCANDVAKEILKLKREGIEGLIIDLRYNGGGSMQEAIELAGLFIDAGPVGQYKSRDTSVFVLKDRNRGTIYDGPLMIMVNGQSASASEMVAGTLQDYNRALIIGSSTYGKATAQVVLPMDTTVTLTAATAKLKAHAYLKTTVSQLFRVTGNTAQALGVQPDIELPDLSQALPQREADEDNVLLSTPIASAKYFKPYVKTDALKLQQFAKNKIDTSSYFTFIKKYIASEKQKVIKEISLKLSDALKEMNDSPFNFDLDNLKKSKAPYTVLNTSYQNQQMLINTHLKEMSEQWKSFLISDPALHVAFETMLLMTK